MEQTLNVLHTILQGAKRCLSLCLCYVLCNFKGFSAKDSLQNLMLVLFYKILNCSRLVKYTLLRLFIKKSLSELNCFFPTSQLKVFDACRFLPYYCFFFFYLSYSLGFVKQYLSGGIVKIFPHSKPLQCRIGLGESALARKTLIFKTSGYSMRTYSLYF